MRSIFTLISTFLYFGLNIFAQPFSSQDGFQKSFIDNIKNLDPIEGFWRVKPNTEVQNMTVAGQEINLAILRNKEYKGYADQFKAYKIENGFYSPGNYDITIYHLDGNFYRIELLNYQTNLTLRGNFSLQPTGSYFSFKINTTEMDRRITGLSYNTNTTWTYVKLFPLQSDIIQYSSQPTIPSTSSIEKSSGTGFALSNNGLVVTNFHIVNNSKSLRIVGVNGNFQKKYSVKVLITDKNSDLALLKIDDFSFSGFGNIPYAIKSNTIDVGSEIYVLGYPLTATMGEEIKLTTGVISSKSGFQGDITTYQISAPVQPGNSGAPLFDKSGYLVGIINAKHSEAENAGYAIKSPYLINLIESLPNNVILNSNNALIGKPLTEQVKLLKNFIFKIEVEY